MTYMLLLNCALKLVEEINMTEFECIHAHVPHTPNNTLKHCLLTAGPQPGSGPWHQLYRAARGLRKLQYATRFH